MDDRLSLWRGVAVDVLLSSRFRDRRLGLLRRGCWRRGRLPSRLRGGLRLRDRWWRGRRSSGRSRWRFLRRWCIGDWLSLVNRFVFNGLFFQETEDVVQDEVAIRLLSKEERLDEFLPGLSLVGHLADDLNDDTAIRRRLSIY